MGLGQSQLPNSVLQIRQYPADCLVVTEIHHLTLKLRKAPQDRPEGPSPPAPLCLSALAPGWKADSPLADACLLQMENREVIGKEWWPDPTTIRYDRHFRYLDTRLPDFHPNLPGPLAALATSAVPRFGGFN